MILYYGLGGGLGHISRAFALIAAAPESIRQNIRLLVSSDRAEVARPHSPCPMDSVPGDVTGRRHLYQQFLTSYLIENKVDCIVLDTFPFGLLAELKDMVPNTPRFLVGRYLRWDAYLERCGGIDSATWPRVAFLIEEQEDAFNEKMARHSRIVPALYPVTLAEKILKTAPAGAGGLRTDDKTGGRRACRTNACAVIHSGPSHEMDILVRLAERIMSERGMSGTPEIYNPARGVFPFPAEDTLSRFSDLVAGAGYGTIAAAAVLSGRVRYHLHPFPRRFDNQALRLRLFQDGIWGRNDGGTTTVAEMLWGEVASL